MTLPETYASMVVVATPTVEPGLPPMVTRIRNAVGNGFEVKIQRADGLTDPVEGVTVRYVVVEEGVYTKEVHGVRMEAKKFISTVTASSSPARQRLHALSGR